MKRMILVALVVTLGRAAAAEEQLIFDYDAVVACLDDADKLCKGVALGEGRIEACIKQNAAKLALRCAKELALLVAQQSQSTRP